MAKLLHIFYHKEGTFSLLCQQVQLFTHSIFVFSHATFLGCTEKRTLIFLQCPIHDQTKNGAGNHLTNSDCQHHKRNWKCYTITVTQYERNDNDIRNDWWKCCDNWFLLTQFPCKKCTDQCCNTAKYNIRKDRTAQNITDQTSGKESRNSSWCKYW